LSERLGPLQKALLAWGEEALVFLSALVQGLGLCLGSKVVFSSQAAAAQGLLVRMEGLGGDAALCTQALAARVVGQKGGIC
jgi:hypothetical protein